MNHNSLVPLGHRGNFAAKVIWAQAAYLFASLCTIQMGLLRKPTWLLISCAVVTGIATLLCILAAIKARGIRRLWLPLVPPALLLVPAGLLYVALYFQGFFDIRA